MSEEEKNFLENIKNLLSDLEDTEDGAIISLNQEEIDSLKLIPKLIEKQQKELERERQYTDFYKDLCVKQQKELRNNKKFKKDIVNLIMLWDKEKLPENNAILETLKTIMSEFSRLEDIEDKKIEVAVDFVNEKRDKYWKDKIRKKIKELENEAFKSIAISEKINVLKELLEEN